MVGQSISHYKILEKLGGGGMGIVYKAQDLRLDRLVALKFLPSHLDSEEEEKHRFIHEAKAASALDHNNICTIHEVDATPDGQTFIVMAYYEGETLKKRIERGPLKIDEAVGIAIQVAQGLGKAHEHAIVHRDIKPANIMLTKDGVAKIVDFGLAKLRGQTVLTKAGTTMGTVQYMSPEQARGEPADHRSDIWALGTVIYEMVTGRSPFRGDYENAVVYGILNTTPEPMSGLRTGVPMELERIVLKSLAKDPEERYQHVDELAVDLKRLRKETTGVTVVAGQRPTDQMFPAATTGMTPTANSGLTPKTKVALGGSILAILFVIVLMFVVPKRGPELNPNSVTRILPIPFKNISYPTLSPDGNWIAFGAIDDRGRADVYLMNLSGGEPRRVTFDSIYAILYSDISDDGALIAYVRWNAIVQKWGIAVVPSLGGVGRLIVAQGGLPLWMPQRHRLSYIPHSKALGMPGKSGKFEIWSVESDGSDPRMEYTDSVGVDWGSVCYSWSPDGRAFAFIRTFQDGAKEVVVHDCATGKERQITFDKKNIDEVRWTHSEQIIYSSTRSGKSDLWMIAADGGESLQLTRGSGSVSQGRLSNDGKRLVYFEKNWGSRLKIGNLTTGKVQQVTNDEVWRGGIGISPDGRYLAFVAKPNRDELIPANDIFLFDRHEQRQWRLLQGKGNLYSLAWSPDGKRIAYETSSDSVAPQHEIFVTPALEPGPPRLIGKGSDPLWFDSNTVGWSFESRTWVSSATDPHPVQFYEDSTRAFPVFRNKYISFRKPGGYRWLDMTPNKKDPARKQVRLIYKESWPNCLTKEGQEMVALERPAKLVKFVLPEVKKVEIPYDFPGLVYWFSVSGNGQEVAYTDVVADSKLVLIENPFK